MAPTPGSAYTGKSLQESLWEHVDDRNISSFLRLGAVPWI